MPPPWPLLLRAAASSRSRRSAEVPATAGGRWWNRGMTSSAALRNVATAVLAVAVLAGCTGPAGPPPPSAASSYASAERVGPVQPAGDPQAVTTGLASPWSVVPLPGAAGEALVSERDTGVIEHLAADGSLTPLTTVAGVVHEGEGGLLGL